MARRLGVETAPPVVLFALGRLAVTLVGLGAMLVLSVPEDLDTLALVAALALSWSTAMVFVALHRPDRAFSALVAAGDFAVLISVELLAPETYGGVRFAALFLIAAHAHFRGARHGLAMGALGSASLVTATVLAGDAPVDGDVLAFYEMGFVICALSGAVLMGRLRTAETTGRLQARVLARRRLQTESESRRRVAEAIHDGPVQELIGLDMMLASATKATAEGRGDDAAKLLAAAREVAGRSVHELRDEIVELDPYAFQAIGFDTVVERCIRVWRRRYGFAVVPAIERLDLPAELTADLFRVAQEAVVNAGRHAHAQTVSISLRRVNSSVELEVSDDGHGFNGINPAGASEPGHIGLACMRERAELMRGKLDIESSERGTRVLVRVPLE